MINEDTPIIPHPNLEIFSQLPVQNAIEETKTYRFTPYAQLNTGSNYEIKVTSSANEFIPLDKIRLRVKFRVNLRRTDNLDVVATDWDKVSVVNNFLHSLWSQIDVFLGDTPITSSLQTYPYLAYMMTLFDTPKRQQDTSKALAMYTDDNMSTASKDTPVKSRSDQIKADSAPFGTGKMIALQDYLYVDPFKIPLDMLGKIEMTVRLIPAKTEFLFMVSDNKLIPSIEFNEIQLVVEKHRINGSVMGGIYGALSTNAAKYPYKRREVRSYTIENGTTSKNIDNMIIGQMPQKLFLAFANNQAVTGSLTKNPFYFGNYKIDYLQCYINGDPVRTEPYQPDFDNNIYDDEYLEFLRITGNLNSHPLTTITPSKWQYGFTIFAFDATQDKSEGFDKTGYLNIRKEGFLRISMRFKQALTESVNCLLFAIFDNQLGFDTYRNVYMDNI